VFYGRRRAYAERVLPRIRELLRAGVQDFAGVPMSGLGIALGVGQLVVAAVRAAAPGSTSAHPPGRTVASRVR
jgi:hypothetical protein